MRKLFQALNSIIPEFIKLRLVKLYRQSPLCYPHIIFHPALLCNYQCSYCLYPKYLTGDDSVWKAYLSYQEWITLFHKFPKSTITISGGEPLLYKDLDKLILGLAKKHVISQVISNISVNLDVLVRAKAAHFRVMTSFHKEMTSLDAFSKNLLYLKKHGMNVVVNYVGTKENLKEWKYYKDYFECKIGVAFRVDAYEGLEREIENLNVKIHGINYISDREQYNNYQRKKCLAGCKYFIVKPNADVYRCHGAFLYLNAPAYKEIVSKEDIDRFRLGNLRANTFRIDEKEFICHSPCRGVCDIEVANVRIVKR